MKATMGTTIPTAIATPTITILFPIFYLATTTVPTAIATPIITILFPIIPMATGTGTTATAVGTEDIVDLAFWLPVGHGQRPVHPGSDGR